MTVYEFLEIMNQDHIKRQSSVYSPFVYNIPNDSGHTVIFRPINNVFHKKSERNPEEKIVFFVFIIMNLKKIQRSLMSVLQIKLYL